jgi:hypothetical protein
MKSRKERSMGYAACMGDRRVAYRVLVGKPDRKRLLEDLGMDRRIILKWIFKKWDDVTRTGSIYLRIRTGGLLL